MNDVDLIKTTGCSAVKEKFCISYLAQFSVYFDEFGMFLGSGGQMNRYLLNVIRLIFEKENLTWGFVT